MRNGRFSILIVDDDEPIREVLMWILGDEYCCSVAAGADQAMGLLSARSFSLVLADLKMPGASGFELCRAIKLATPETVVLLMSSINEPLCASEAAKCGASGYLVKSSDLFHIESIVKSLFEDSETGAEK